VSFIVANHKDENEFGMSVVEKVIGEPFQIHSPTTRSQIEIMPERIGRSFRECPIESVEKLMGEFPA
jgi:hypothetical protein